MTWWYLYGPIISEISNHSCRLFELKAEIKNWTGIIKCLTEDLKDLRKHKATVRRKSTGGGPPKLTSPPGKSHLEGERSPKTEPAPQAKAKAKATAKVCAKGKEAKPTPKASAPAKKAPAKKAPAKKAPAKKAPAKKAPAKGNTKRKEPDTDTDKPSAPSPRDIGKKQKVQATKAAAGKRQKAQAPVAGKKQKAQASNSAAVNPGKTESKAKKKPPTQKQKEQAFAKWIQESNLDKYKEQLCAEVGDLVRQLPLLMPLFASPHPSNSDAHADAMRLFNRTQ